MDKQCKFSLFVSKFKKQFQKVTMEFLFPCICIPILPSIADQSIPAGVTNIWLTKTRNFKIEIPGFIFYLYFT